MGSTLYVDYRDGSKELIEPLQQLGLPAEKATIDADLLFEGRGEGGEPVSVAVEFKKLGELVDSLQTQRLQGHQLLKMQQFDFRWLLVEGELHWDNHGVLTRRKGHREFVPMNGHMSVNELLKRMFVLQLRGGLNPLWAQNRRETLKLIETLYRTWTDEDLDQHKSHLAIYRPPPLLQTTRFRTVVGGLPEVGMKVGLAAQEEFGTIRHAICLTTEKDWADLELRDRKGNTKRLGTKTAAKIMEAIDERF